MWDVSEPDEFGALLRHYRLAAGLTQEALAERARLAVRSIPGLEAGEHRPQRDTLRRLSEALGLSEERSDHLRAVARRLPESRNGPRHNLPVQLTSFVGRQAEVADIARALDPPEGSVAARPRLVTLTGTGGCGKTRLALQVAARVLSGYADGVWFVNLAPMEDQALVPQTVCAAMDIGVPPGSAPVAALTEYLRSRHSLLVVDNCEHLLDACARLVDALLRDCPRLHILATSREALRIEGEVSRRVPSLALPDVAHLPPVAMLTDFDAVHLFAERAVAVRSDFDLTDRTATAVVQICSRLDGIPLALELAAAWVRVLSPEELAARLNNGLQLLAGGSRTAPPRHQTLQATLAWSYDLLTDRERSLFDRLSVFAGGWTIQAAEEVCAGDDIERIEVLDIFTRLVDQSLIVVGETDGGEVSRYRLLEPLRQYGRERLTARIGSEAVHDRHAAYYLGLAERAEPDAVHLASLNDMGSDIDNFRAALHWLLDHGAIEDGLRLAASMGELWSHLGLSGEGYAWLRKLLDLPPGGTNVRTRARAQCWAGALGLMVGDAGAGQALLLDSLAFGRAAKDDALVGEAAVRLGLLTVSSGDYATARQLFEESLAARRRSGSREQVIRSMNFVALATIWQGDSDDATRALLEEAIVQAQAIGYWNWTAACMGTLGLHAMMHGDQGLARARWDESLRLFEGSMDWPEVSMVQNYLARLDALEDNLAAARAGYAASIALTRPARFIFRITDSLDGLAAIAARQGDMVRALQVAGASAAFRQAAGYLPPPYARAELERALRSARGAVGGAAADAAWAGGQAMTFDEAVDAALRI